MNLSNIKSNNELIIESENEINSDSDSSNKLDNEEEINKKLSATEILKILCSYNLVVAFPNLFLAYKYLCTIPTTSASSERSFSKYTSCCELVGGWIDKIYLAPIIKIAHHATVATNDAKGEDEVKRVSRTLGFSELESVVDFRSRNVFSSFMKALNILPASTADCERGFSDMNLTITDLRTSLNIENVSDLMFISINGPSVADFNPRPYIKIWLRDHRSAVSTPRGKERKE
ncbi:hypothetical protein QTP88_019576 [Uroleucon formosanum]